MPAESEMSEQVTAAKGMNDVRPGAEEPFLDSAIWERIFTAAGEVMGGHGYQHVWLPIVEHTALFARGIGEDTDIVSKEMFTFDDRGGRSLSLRPEGTAGAVRAYVEHSLARVDPVQRWWYGGPMFRAERPQKARYRQFYQIGAELLGIASPTADAELLLMLHRLCERLQLGGVKIRLNSVGDAESRRAYRGVLQGFLRERRGELCESCAQRIETNPLRTLDCKRESCRRVVAAAPDILESLTEASRTHFQSLRGLCDELRIPYERDARLVRGLDYYTGTTFEFTAEGLGAQDAILGGGRYDDLVAELGGPPTPAIGFAAGVERLALVMAQQGVAATGPDLYMIPMAGAEARALSLADEMRRAGRYRVELDVGGGRLKQQMRRADRLRARYALVLGEEELATKRGRLKDLRASSEMDVEITGEALARALSGIQER